MYLPVRVIVHLLGEKIADIWGNILPQALVSGARLLMLEDKASDPGTIYICHFSELPAHGEILDNMLFACVLERGEEAGSGPENMAAMLFRDITLSDLLFIVQDIFSRVAHWNHEMIRCIVEKNLQKLLDSSKDIIGNTIIASDSNFSLIAYTLSRCNSDNRVGEMVSTRAFSKDVIDRFIRENVAWECRNQQEIEIKTSFKYSKYVLATYTVMVDDYYFLRVTMFFDQKGIDQGLVDLFAMLLENIKVYVKCVPGIADTYKEKYGAFILDMIGGRITDSAVSRMRARLCGIDPEAPMSVYKVDFSPQQEKNHLEAFLGKLKNIWPSARVIPRDSDIIIVTDQSKSELSESGIYKLLAPLLEEHGAVCGFSVPCGGVERLRSAYTQAELAIKYGVQIRGNRLSLNCGLIVCDEFGDSGLFPYEAYYIYRIFDNTYQENRELFENTQSMRLLLELWASDRRDGMNNLQLVREYLTRELKATETAKALHMHRNNILYRISRIEKLYGANFSDPEQRFKILLAYRMLDYYGEIWFAGV